MKSAYISPTIHILWWGLLFIFNMPLWAQQEYFVSGRVLDSLRGKPLESCAVGFYNSKNQLVSGSVTDQKGYFELTVAPGQYQMVLEYIGYEKKKIPVIVRQNNQFLGTFLLSVSATELSEVKIKAKAASFKIDKEVFVVTKKMKISAANAWDVLDHVQGVSYDRYNNSIKVDGRTNVKILVNGLEKNMQYIQNLNPDRIKKIEIIRDPGGRYGLEGYAAVINIILKQNYTGTDLSLLTMNAMDPDTKNPAYLWVMSINNAEWNYTYNKINLYAGAALFSNHFAFPIHGIKTFDTGKQIIQNPPNDATNFFFTGLVDNASAGIDYYIDPQHVLSIETGMEPILANRNNQKTLFDVKVYKNGTISHVYALQNVAFTHERSHYQSLFYSATGKNQSQFHLTFKHDFNASENQLSFHNNKSLHYTVDQHDSSHQWHLESDYIFPLNEHLMLQTGYGFIDRHERELTQKLDSANALSGPSTVFNYIERRHRIFAYATYRPDKKWSIKTGIAGEISMPQALGMHAVYRIYQPYLDVKYRISTMVDVVLKYRSQSIYPQLSQTNPQEIFENPFTISKGNPRLRPAVIHKISLRTLLMGGIISLEPYYHFSGNYIGQTGYLRADSLFEYTYNNLGQYRHYGVRGNLMVPLGKKFLWQTNFDIYHSAIRHEDMHHAFNDYSLNSNLMYVDKNNGLTLGLLYQRALNKHITALGYRQWQNDFTALLFQKPFMDKHLNIMLMYILPWDLGVSYEQKTFVRINGYESLHVNDLHILRNMIVFRLNYLFHKGKTTRQIQKDTGEEKPQKPSKGLF